MQPHPLHLSPVRWQQPELQSAALARARQRALHAALSLLAPCFVSALQLVTLGQPRQQAAWQRWWSSPWTRDQGPRAVLTPTKRAVSILVPNQLAQISGGCCPFPDLQQAVILTQLHGTFKLQQADPKRLPSPQCK